MELKGFWRKICLNPCLIVVMVCISLELAQEPSCIHSSDCANTEQWLNCNSHVLGSLEDCPHSTCLQVLIPLGNDCPVSALYVFLFLNIYLFLLGRQSYKERRRHRELFHLLV